MIQALFTMPFINRDGGDLPVIKAGFKYFRAISIPLALFVLRVWAVGMLLPWRRWWSGVKRGRKRADVEDGSRDRMKGE